MACLICVGVCVCVKYSIAKQKSIWFLIRCNEKFSSKLWVHIRVQQEAILTSLVKVLTFIISANLNFAYTIFLPCTGERTGAMQTSASFKPRPVCVGVFASAALTSVIAHVHNIAVDVPLAASTPVALATATTFVCRLIKVICEYGIAIIKLMLTKDCMRALIPRWFGKWWIEFVGMAAEGRSRRADEACRIIYSIIS